MLLLQQYPRTLSLKLSFLFSRRPYTSYFRSQSYYDADFGEKRSPAPGNASIATSRIASRQSGLPLETIHGPGRHSPPAASQEQIPFHF